jgi:DNA-binding transcriptional LysR family regulator
MDRLTSMSVFVKVVAHHSFAVAAREMRLSRAGVSKHILALEQSLGARLLNRNTRRLSLTEIGAVVHERYARILEEIEEVERSAGALQMNPRGVLRISAPISIGLTHLAPFIADYMARYHEVSIDMVLNASAQCLERWLAGGSDYFWLAHTGGRIGSNVVPDAACGDSCRGHPA